MGGFELIALAVGGGIVLLVAVIVILGPSLGGDRRLGGKEHDYAGNQPTAGGDGD